MSLKSSKGLRSLTPYNAEEFLKDVHARSDALTRDIAANGFPDLNVEFVFGSSQGTPAKKTAAQTDYDKVSKIYADYLKNTAKLSEADVTIALGKISDAFEAVQKKGSIADMESFQGSNGKFYYLVGLCLDQMNGADKMIDNGAGDKDFITLHELGHVVDAEYYNGVNRTNAGKEIFADAFSAYYLYSKGDKDAFEKIAAYRAREDDLEYPFHRVSNDLKQRLLVIESKGGSLRDITNTINQYVDEYETRQPMNNTRTGTQQGKTGTQANPGLGAKPSAHEFSYFGALKTTLYCAAAGAVIVPLIPFAAATLLPGIAIGAVVGGGLGLVGGVTGQALNKAKDSDRPAEIFKKLALAATIAVSAVLGLGQRLKNNDLADGKVDKSAEVFLDKDAKTKAPAAEVAAPKESPYLKAQREAAAKTAATKAADSAATPAPTTTTPEPATATPTPTTTTPTPATPSPAAATPAPAAAAPVVEAPSITNGLSELKVRYLPLQGVMNDVGKLSGMKFAMFEMDANGNVTRERLGTYYGGDNLVWGGTGLDIKIARELLTVKKCTLIEQTADQQRVMLDNGRVAIVDHKTGAVTSIADATQEDRDAVAGKRAVDYKSANEYLVSHRAPGAKTLVQDTTFTFKPGNKNSSVNIQSGDLVIVNNKVFAETKDTAGQKVRVPANQDQVDGARFFKNLWKNGPISMAPLTQVNSQLAMAGLQGSFRNRG